MKRGGREGKERKNISTAWHGNVRETKENREEYRRRGITEKGKLAGNAKIKRKEINKRRKWKRSKN